MCGISGIWWGGGGEPAWQDVARRAESMSAVQRHRGPDDSGVLRHGGAVLSFARLSIIDLEGGHQPMADEGGRYAIVFNGEIYNYRELRAKLEQDGLRFRTRSDTEALLHGLRIQGDQFVEGLRGMFGFAFHDQQSNRLLLARDRLGIKPLYYARVGDGLVFASEIKGVFASGLVGRELDQDAFLEYLSFGYVCAPRTIYREIRCLQPGHLLVADADGIREERYWSVGRRDLALKSIDEATERLEELLREAIRMRLIADVPLGALLSGGLDSGIVVALMAQIHDEPIKTFSIGFKEERHNELPGARAVAERYGTRHTELICEPNIVEMIPRILESHDQPFGDSSALPTRLVCELARRDVTVALSGDGGDEVFAGYARHTRFVKREESGHDNPLLRAGARALASAIPPTWRGAQRLRRQGLSAREIQVDGIVLTESRLLAGLCGSRVDRTRLRQRAIGSALVAAGAFADGAPLAAFQHQDLTHYLPSDILTKVDIASMQHSLEVRVPILDHPVVDFGLNLPAAWKNDGVHGKLVMRELARKHLPPEHLEKRKSGFAIPLAQWLGGPLREFMRDHLDDSKLAQDGWLSQSSIDLMIEQHLHGRSRASILWLLLCAEHWYRGEPGGASATAAS